MSASSICEQCQALNEYQHVSYPFSRVTFTKLDSIFYLPQQCANNLDAKHLCADICGNLRNPSFSYILVIESFETGIPLSHIFL